MGEGRNSNEARKKKGMYGQRNITMKGKRRGNPEEYKYLHPRKSGCAVPIELGS